MIQNVKKFPKNPGVYPAPFRNKRLSRDVLKLVPKRCGVYFFRDKNRRILYIGKAANLKSRLKSYFNSRLQDPRISKMLEAAKNIDPVTHTNVRYRVDWQETNSEIEALILESQLIKKFRPSFNIMLRDDKQYFYVVFTKEKFPKIFITHQPTYHNKRMPKGRAAKPQSFVWCVGPFTDGTALKVTLKLLRRVFPYCTCKQKHNNYCLNYYIGNCPGFCCLKKEVAAKEKKLYQENIRAIKAILNGQKKSLVKKFEKELNTLAQKEKFEKAIKLRDKIEKLKIIFENARIVKEIDRKETSEFGALIELKEALHLPVLPKRIEGYDVSNIQGEFATGAMAVFTDGRPDKNEYRKFRIRTAGGDTGMLREIITRRFNHPEWPYPDLIIIDGGKGQFSTATAAILKSLPRRQAGKILNPKKIAIAALVKDIRHKGKYLFMSTKKVGVLLKKLPPAVRNLILQIDAEAHRFAINYYRKLHLKAQN